MRQTGQTWGIDGLGRFTAPFGYPNGDIDINEWNYDIWGQYMPQHRPTMQAIPNTQTPVADTTVIPGVAAPTSPIKRKVPLPVIGEEMPGIKLPFAGFRRYGGPVEPRKRYIVGEAGPEEIVLDQPGTVVPLPQIATPAARDDLPTIGTSVTPRPMQPLPERPSLPQIAEPPAEPQQFEGLPATGADGAMPKIGQPYNRDAELADAEARLADTYKFKDKKWTFWDKVAAAVEGWAKGGIFGGIAAVRDPHYFERQRNERARADILPKIGELQTMRKLDIDAENRSAQAELARQKPLIEREKLATKVQIEKDKFDNRTKVLEIQARNEGGKWKPYVDEQGRRWKQFQNDPTKELEPIVDPTTGEQDVDPNFKLYNYTDPVTGTQVQITGRILSDRGARQAEFNARQVQDIAKTNESNRIRVQQENVNNSIQVNKQRLDAIAAAINADTSLKDNATIQALNPQIQAKNEMLQGLMNEPPPSSADEKENERIMQNRIERINKLTDEIVKLSGDIITAVGSSQAGRAKAEEIRKNLPKAPPKLTYTPLKPVTVAPGKVVPPSKDPLGLFR